MAKLILRPVALSVAMTVLLTVTGCSSPGKRSSQPASPAPAAPASVSRPAIASASPIDGAWELVTTLADLRALGAAGEDLVPENYGVGRLVLDKGRFAVTGHNDPACTWAYGKYTVTGKRIELSFTAGGGISPNHAANKPGELFDYYWSAYHDKMVWSAVPGTTSPPGWTIRPWRLVGKKPSAHYLDPKCPPPAVAFTG